MTALPSILTDQREAQMNGGVSTSATRREVACVQNNRKRDAQKYPTLIPRRIFTTQGGKYTDEYFAQLQGDCPDKAK